MIYFFITIFLDFFFSSFISLAYQNISIFFPVLLIGALPVVYVLLKNKKSFFILIVVTGIVYDTIFSDIFLINSYFFILYGLFIYSYYKKHDYRLLNMLLISVLGIVFYDVFIFFMLIFANYSNFVINDLYYKIIRSILINIIYVLLSILLLNSRIFGYKKRRKRKLKGYLFHNIL